MQEVALLEFVEDSALFELRGHASCSAYGVAAALGADLVAHLSAVSLQRLSTRLKLVYAVPHYNVISMALLDWMIQLPGWFNLCATWDFLAG